MKLRSYVAVAALVALSALAVGAQEPPKQMTPEQQAAMDEMMKLATPGVAHKVLERMAGRFDVKATTWEAPGAAPATSMGTSEARMVLGGRFLHDSFTSEFWGMPYEGVGYTGYDNYKQKYVSVWMDNFGTMMLTMTGTCDAPAKRCEFVGEVDDAMMKKTCTVRSVTTFVDERTHRFEMYYPGPDGKEFKMMEMVYTRK